MSAFVYCKSRYCKVDMTVAKIPCIQWMVGRAGRGESEVETADSAGTWPVRDWRANDRNRLAIDARRAVYRDESMHARIANSTAPVFRRALSRFQRRTPWICTSCQTRSGRNRSISTQPASEKPYYITTPIFYVNAAPHVGHLYTMVLTDILKRWQVLKGRNALLLTGTDEHGLKVQRAAAKAGVDPKLFCDKGAEIFKVHLR
jgi:hypothetical protein